MNENPSVLISIGLPVVKLIYLAEAIDCCINQTYTNIEIIILNNANTKIVGDEIENIVLGFTDGRIKYFRNERQLPMIVNWNKLLSYSSGDFFSILSDDDKWEPNFISNLFMLSKKYSSVNIFHSRILVINENEKILNISPLCPEKEDSFDFIFHRIKGWRLQFLSDFLVRTYNLKEIGGFTIIPDGWGSDDITWFKIASKGGVAYDSNLLFKYRNHPSNVSNSKKLKAKFDSIPIYAQNVKKIILSMPELTSLDKSKKELLISELKSYQKKHYLKLTHKRIKNIVIFKSLAFFIYMIYMGYKSVFGWKNII